MGRGDREEREGVEKREGGGRIGEGVDYFIYLFSYGYYFVFLYIRCVIVSCFRVFFLIIFDFKLNYFGWIFFFLGDIFLFCFFIILFFEKEYCKGLFIEYREE